MAGPLMAAPAAQPPPLRVPRTTAYRKRKAAQADAARGGPSPWSKARRQTGHYTCSKCGQAKRIDTGHTRIAGVSYCAAAGGKAVEEWREEMKRLKRDREGGE
ncbi:3-ketoacyl-CoA synthase 7 [Dissostichus eleginoides]|uniref:3-ketoacyl-CoA synthase 7 n=1 Tax=Dissostichus eleginoides TaxID=100907 RepID=A0AAD9CSA2_DISEL|nr:3-ketoacyl-CoA synthase 7 [Dissostichus eleginoides]